MCHERDSQAGAQKLLLEREFPATQCTPVRELQNSIPENIFFATPVLIWQHGENSQEIFHWFSWLMEVNLK